MEINGRFWGSLELAVSSGADFPAGLVDFALGKNVESDPYEIDHCCRWMRGELEYLYLALFKNPISKPSFSEKIRLIFDFINPIKFNTDYFVLSLRDPKPFVIENINYVKANRKKIFKR
jgi:hypothetical protein